MNQEQIAANIYNQLDAIETSLKVDDLPPELEAARDAYVNALLNLIKVEA